MSTKTITLDFYNHNIVYLKAKQNDTDRQVKVTCTDHGKKVTLDPSKYSAFVKYKKSDGNFAFNEANILDTGEVFIELTSQMLAVTGKQMIELAIVRSEGLAVDNLSSVQGFEDLGVSIISTIPFYVNVVKSVLDDSEVTSLTEFSVLTAGIARMVAVDKYMDNLESELESNEQSRKDAEALRIAAETNRVNTEASRISAEKGRVSAESSRVSAEKGRVSAETGRVDAEKGRVSAESSRVSAETSRASIFDTLKTDLEDAIEQMNEATTSGAVTNSQIGVANGVATLNENAIIPSEQLPFVNALDDATTSGKIMDAKALSAVIKQLNSTFNTAIANLHQVHFGTTEPSNSIGKDGDIYMQLLVSEGSENTVEVASEMDGE